MVSTRSAPPTQALVLRAALMAAATCLAMAGSIALPVGTGARADGHSGTGLTGPARVIDGDTIEVRGVRVRLFGIDAPETGQNCQASGQAWPCGTVAARMLERRIAQRVVTCRERDRDRYGRIVAVCRAGNEDLNAWMTSHGWALAWRRYSRDYEAEEAAAQRAGRGVWTGRFIPPWDWRKGERLAATERPVQPRTRRADPAPRLARCAIKGNVSVRTGERIYHLPGGEYYDATRINPAYGERWFCTEAQARAAGWRRSKR